MKIISLNIAAFNTATFEDNNKEVVEYLSEQDADILCLQEVARALDKNAKEKFRSKELIDEKLGQRYPYRFYAPFWAIDHFKKSDIYTEQCGGLIDLGNYILSKYPITKGEAFFPQAPYTYITSWENWPEVEYKNFISAQIQIGEKSVQIVNYHGLWTRDKLGNEHTKKGCQMILEETNNNETPIIIVGDFNLFQTTESMKILTDAYTDLVHEYGYKTTRPKTNELAEMKNNVVDYALVNDRVKVTDFLVDDNDVSDHLPLILDFEI